MKKLISVLALCACMFQFIHAQNRLEGFEFIDRDISEILYSISMYNGNVIVGDDTVHGRADFRFAGENFESAFDSFLNSQRLYVDKQDSLWTVSRVHISPCDDGYFLDACDVKPSLLAEKISIYFRQEISYDMLPDSEISIHCRGQNAGDFAAAIARQLGSLYECTKNSGYIKISRVTLQENDSFLGAVNSALNSIQKYSLENGDFYSADIQNASAGAVLQKLFELEECQYVFCCDAGFAIPRAVFADKSFSESLELICRNSSLEAIESQGIYYVFENKLSSHPVLSEHKAWCTIPMLYTNVDTALSLIESRFGNINAIRLAESNSILCQLDESEEKELRDFVSTIDVPASSYSVSLQYIKTEDFLSRLPPGIPSSSIVRGTQDNQFFFCGTKGQYEELESYLKVLDCPVKRLRYDLLVIQYLSSSSEQWQPAVSMRRLSIDDRNNVSAVLGSVLDFNLDVVSAFGINFAASLQAAVNENKAQVFADSTLHGVSGGTISFKNVSTYRYRDSNLDPETGRPIYTGVTREIESGLKIDVTGWVSGDGMITSRVTASVSRQGADLSSSTGNPPPSSEKVITTEVRCKSGEPIVLSGLIQNEKSFIEQRTPFLSRIPIIGHLFRGKDNTQEKSQMVIYLVPHWEQDAESQSQNFQKESFLELEERLVKTYGNL